MEENQNVGAVQPEVGEQQQSAPVVQDNAEYTPLSFKDKVLLAFAICLGLFIGIAAIKSMDRSDVNATQILEDADSYDILDSEVW